MVLVSRPKTYQDVKNNLRWVTVFIMLFMGILVFAFILPDSQKQWFPAIKSLGDTIGISIFSAFCGMIGWLLIYFFEIHDKIYDKFVVKWRYYFTIDLIIPRLFRPIFENLDRSFYRRLKDLFVQYMKPYYEFVGDRAGDKKIDENYVVRFYEAVQKYWMTQIMELALFTVFLTSVVYVMFFSSQINYSNITWLLIILISMFIINRCLVIWTRKQTRQATIDEIDEIHKSRMEQFKEEVKIMLEKNGLEYTCKK